MMQADRSKPILVAQWGLLDELVRSGSGQTDAVKFLDYLSRKWDMADASSTMDALVGVGMTKSDFLRALDCALRRNRLEGRRNLQIVYIGSHGRVNEACAPLGLASDVTDETIEYRELGATLCDALKGFPHNHLVLGSCSAFDKGIANNPDAALEWVPFTIDTVVGFTECVNADESLAGLKATYEAYQATFRGHNRGDQDVSATFWCHFRDAYGNECPSGPEPIAFERPYREEAWQQVQ